jgi:hypothetical protein
LFTGNLNSYMNLIQNQEVLLLIKKSKFKMHVSKKREFTQIKF